MRLSETVRGIASPRFTEVHLITTFMFSVMIISLITLITLITLVDPSPSWAEENEDTTVIGHRHRQPVLKDRATSSVGEAEVREGVTRSTPEALGDEVGAYVQQTAHGQGSVYLRGRTGRHTLLMVDGFRLNHALFRQGPNQYLFTIDPLSVRVIDVLRGGGAVRLGANALAGSILVESKRPTIDPSKEAGQPNLKLTGIYATADLSRGVRAEGQQQLTRRWGIYLSGGWLKREELEASGPLERSPDTPLVLQLEKNVPRFKEDQRLQRGTGYKALSGDIVSRVRLDQGDWILAARLFRQYDSPRTDQCPPPEAPETWCLNYDEQFRTHIYSRIETKTENHWAREIWAGVSFQRQHERRTNDRENYLNVGRDSVNVWEGRGRASTSSWTGDMGELSLSYGLDATIESVSSKAWDTLVRSEITREQSRGQYIEGSAYSRAGGWSELNWQRGALRVRGGARLSYAYADSPKDLATETEAINRSWRGLTLGGGATWRVSKQWRLTLNLEEGFAPPNLDDLTARQLTGQGYQIENPALEAESSLTTELGLQFRGRWPRRGEAVELEVEIWGFAMQLYDGIERRDAICPMSERSCIAARISTPFTLSNLNEPAQVYGAEHQVVLRLPYRLSLSEHLSYAVSEGPSPLPSEAGQRRALSRTPPLNGGVRVRWDSPQSTFYTQAGVRWASAQDRLSFGDEIDHRIPYGGTPRYTVYHAQLGIREGPWELNINIENLTDVAYRVHGSSVNGAARGLSLFFSYSL